MILENISNLIHTVKANPLRAASGIIGTEIAACNALGIRSANKEHLTGTYMEINL
jgi:hypothetical protein